MKSLVTISIFCFLALSVFAQKRKADISFEKGNKCFLKKDYQNALANYCHSIDLYPDADVYFNRHRIIKCWVILAVFARI